MKPWHDNPADVRPMLASVDEPPVFGRGLVYEPKYDGIRALVDVRPPARRGAAPTVAIYSRNGREKSAQFPAIVDALGALARRLRAPLVCDGEIVAIDPDGRPLGFQHIQGRIHLTGSSEIAAAEAAQPAALILFDLLRDGDDDLRSEPLAARRLRLQERVTPGRGAHALVRLSEIATDDGRALLARARREGWEGLIAKDGHSRYLAGRRTPAWRKLKLLKQQEFVVGGWTEPRQSRQHFGALLVGCYDAHGALRWAGSVGTGFDTQELDRVAALLAKRPAAKSAFADPVKTMETPHWVRPDLVVELRFTEWTSDGLLRQPVYLGMRTDKNARDVRRESGETEVLPAVSPSRGRKPPKVKSVSGGSNGDLLDGLSALEQRRKDGDITLPNGDRLHVTNLAKVFWPALGITKGDLLRYYVEVAPLILPVVLDRPLVMKRFPNGVDGAAFYQQKHPEAVPPGVRREQLAAGDDPDQGEGPRDRLIGGSMTTLLYMAQLAVISQDPWFSRVTDPHHQDYAAIDLDPGPGVEFPQVLQVARWVKDALDAYGIPGWPKTSGSRGLHIYVPLPPGTSYETGQVLCQIVATIVATAHPKEATVERMVKRRPRGTVYIDYLQNILGKTLATAYSARASDYAGVSTPLTWAEVARGVSPGDFTIRTAPARFRAVGDLWRGLRTSRPVNLRAVLARATNGAPRARRRR